MIKHLIILSLSILLISCGEEEASTKESPTKEKTTKEETTTVANTQTTATKPDTMKETAKVISEKPSLPEEPAPEETQPPLKEEASVAKVPETEEQPQSETESTLPPSEEGGTYVLNRSFDDIILTTVGRKMFLQKNQCAHIPSMYSDFNLSRGRTTILYESTFPGYKLVSVHSTTIAQEELKGVESHEECSDQNVRRINSQEEIRVSKEEQIAKQPRQMKKQRDVMNAQMGYDVEERKALLKGNSFLVCNGDSDTDVYVEADLVWSPIFSFAFNKKGYEPFQALSKYICVRVHNRHLGNISIRSSSVLSFYMPDWLTGTICKKSDCPTGDIFIEYIENDDGEKEPVARSLQDDDDISRDWYNNSII